MTTAKPQIHSKAWWQISAETCIIQHKDLQMISHVFQQSVYSVMICYTLFKDNFVVWYLFNLSLSSETVCHSKHKEKFERLWIKFQLCKPAYTIELSVSKYQEIIQPSCSFFLSLQFDSALYIKWWYMQNIILHWKHYTWILFWT